MQNYHFIYFLFLESVKLLVFSQTSIQNDCPTTQNNKDAEYWCRKHTLTKKGII